jgi:hypothetical protein
VTQKAFDKTREMMEAIGKARGVNLSLRDIRKLPNLNGEIRRSFHPGTPVFSRVDMGKALIGEYMISSLRETVKYCVVLDVDIKPRSPKQMFNARTLEFLDDYGYVFNKGMPPFDFENSCFILNSEKEGLLKKHHDAIIARMEQNISELRSIPLGKCKSIGFRETMDSQYVFMGYSNFRRSMDEPTNDHDGTFNPLRVPRESVICPQSQFEGESFIKFKNSAHQKEIWRFIGDDDRPYVKYGRSPDKWGGEAQIPALQSWKPVPLYIFS